MQFVLFCFCLLQACEERHRFETLMDYFKNYDEFHIDFMVCWFFDWLAEWFIDWLIDLLILWLIVYIWIWLIILLITDWLIEWWIEWGSVIFYYFLYDWFSWCGENEHMHGSWVWVWNVCKKKIHVFVLLLFQVACMQFVNIVVHSVENMNFRVHLQHEFTIAGLDEYLGVRSIRSVAWVGVDVCRPI
jgi:hypothetical protein